MIGHLRNVHVERLFEEDPVLLIFHVVQKTLGATMLMNQQVSNIAVNLNHWYRSIIHVLQLANPLVL